MDWVGVDIRPRLKEEVARCASHCKLSRVYIEGMLGTLDDALYRFEHVQRPKIYSCWGSTLLSALAGDSRSLKEQLVRHLEALRRDDRLLFSQYKAPRDPGKMVRSCKLKREVLDELILEADREIHIERKKSLDGIT